MNDLNSLHDAFETLERRADAVSASTPEFTIPTRARARTTRVLAPALAVAAVVATAGAVAVWQSGSHGHGTRAGGPPSASPSAVSASPSAPSASPSSTPSASPTATGFQPPLTPDALAARTRSILAGIATITVIKDDARVGAPSSVPTLGPPEPPSPLSSAPATPVLSSPVASNSDVPAENPGSFIRGTLTAAGRSGGYDLNVFTSTPGNALCDADTACTVRRLPDGSSLAVGSWKDPQKPGGVTYQVEVLRPDGADILIHLSTESDPKGLSTVTASRMPLTKQQLIDFVTSTRW